MGGCKPGWDMSCCEGFFCDTSKNHKNIQGAGKCSRAVNATGDSVLCGGFKACVVKLAGPKSKKSASLLLFFFSRLSRLSSAQSRQSLHKTRTRLNTRLRKTTTTTRTAKAQILTPAS